MTLSRFQSGTHIAERICWIRIDCPASKRPSVSASDVRTATRSPHDGVDDRVRERLGRLPGPPSPSAARASATGRPVLVEQDDDGALGREEVEEEVDDLREDLVHLAARR